MECRSAQGAALEARKGLQLLLGQAQALIGQRAPAPSPPPPPAWAPTHSQPQAQGPAELLASPQVPGIPSWAIPQACPGPQPPQPEAPEGTAARELLPPAAVLKHVLLPPAAPSRQQPAAQAATAGVHSRSQPLFPQPLFPQPQRPPQPQQALRPSVALAHSALPHLPPPPTTASKAWPAGMPAPPAPLSRPPLLPLPGCDWKPTAASAHHVPSLPAPPRALAAQQWPAGAGPGQQAHGRRETVQQPRVQQQLQQAVASQHAQLPPYMQAAAAAVHAALSAASARWGPRRRCRDQPGSPAQACEAGVQSAQQSQQNPHPPT